MKRFTNLCKLIVLLTLIPVVLISQEIRIRPQDKLELNVLGREELSRILQVDRVGNVNIPIVGDVHIAGLTIEEAQLSILRKIKDYFPDVTSVNLQLVGEESKRIIYVHGQVLRPGKYELSGTPNVWEAVREAGGATPDASLDAIKLIRAKGDGKRTMIVNLQEAIDTGDFSKLPKLKPGDTIIVPTRAIRQFGSSAVNVIGAVLHPAPYVLTGEKRLIDAILAAGGPTEDANLHKVKLIRNLPDGGTVTMRVDFAKYLEDGDPRNNPIVKPYDTVNVPKHSNYFRTMFTDPRFLLGLLTASGTLAAVLLSR